MRDVVGRDGSVRQQVRTTSEARWTGKVALLPDHLGEPLGWRKPCRVFVNSMSDLFHEMLSNEEIAAVFGVMAACPQHTFQVLTKRPERARRWFGWAAEAPNFEHVADSQRTATALHWFARSALNGQGKPFPAHLWRPWPLPNVWIGVSCEDQATADQRIPELLATPAAVRFVSAEPLLGPVNLSPWLGYDETWDRYVGPCAHGRDPWTRCEVNCTPGQVEGLDWIIVGGESGPGARPFDLAWGRALVDQCGTAGVACFVKQLGARPCTDPLHGRVDWRFEDRKGGNIAEWPDDLRVRQFPAIRASSPPEKEKAPPAGQRLSPGIPAR